MEYILYSKAVLFSPRQRKNVSRSQIWRDERKIETRPRALRRLKNKTNHEYDEIVYAS